MILNKLKQKSKKKAIRYAGMSSKECLQFKCFLSVGILLTIAFGMWWFEPKHIPHNFNHFSHSIDYLLFFILSYIVWHHIMMELFAWYVAIYVKEPEQNIIPEKGLRVAYGTAFVPGSEPYDILEKTLKAMVEVDYPHDTWLLDEGNDSTAKEICLKYGVHHYSRNGRSEFNTTEGKFRKKTKGGNYNSWLHHYENNYDILAQHDVDFIPRKDFLTKTLGYFKDPDVAFVGAPQIYGNLKDSWIAHGAAEQTYGFYGPLQKGFYAHNMTLLIGANHIMRIKAYQDVDGYSAHITEDMLTGMKLYAKETKWKSVYVPEALLIGEGPTTWSAYLDQQMRWAYGCMDIVFRHAPKLLPKMDRRHIFNFIILQQYYFSGIAQALGIGLLSFYFFFGITSANMLLGPILYLYLPLIIYQTIFQLWLQRFNIDPTTERGLLLRGKLLAIAAWPVYFLAFIGVLRKKHLTYKVTPKGNTQEVVHTPSLFTLHLTLGTITLVGIIWGAFTGHTAGPMIFWATLNTIFMYYFFFAEAIPLTITTCHNHIETIRNRYSSKKLFN